MNSKIGDKMLTMISAVAVVDLVASLIDSNFLSFIWETLGLEHFGLWVKGALSFFEQYGIYTFLKVLFVAAILVAVIMYKRSYVNLYAVLKQMSENNKLHAVRAKVMATYKRLTRGYNPFSVESAKFTYRILPVIDEKGSQIQGKYDVEYMLEFIIPMSRRKIFFANLSKRSFRFYAIVENEKGYDIQKCFYQEDGGEIHHFQSVWHDVTRLGGGGDFIQRYSGLQEVTFPLPKHIVKKNRFTYSIQYLCREGLIAKDLKYCFAIIPDNYSRRIKKMSIVVEDTCHAIKNIELQEFDGKQIRTPTAFVVKESVQSEDKKKSYNQADHYNFLFGPIKPEMNSIYFVQYDFKAPDRAQDSKDESNP